MPKTSISASFELSIVQIEIKSLTPARILSTQLAQSWATVYPKMHYSNLADYRNDGA